VKLSTLLELIGSGSILLIVGAGAILVGVGVGFSETTHVPLWVSFCGLGLLTLTVGIVLIDRGSDEAEEQVTNAVSPMFKFVRSPWAGFAAAVIGGIVLQRLCRPRRRIVVKRPVATPVESAPTVAAEEREQAPAPETGFSLSQYLGGQLTSLGTVAAEAAVAMGMQALGVPSLKDLVRDLLGGDQSKSTTPPTNEPDRSECEATADDGDADRGTSTRGSRAPSHNGFNYAEFSAEP
jgi:hypothetical protein